jgi:hypothetical protein
VRGRREGARASLTGRCGERLSPAQLAPVGQLKQESSLDAPDLVPEGVGDLHRREVLPRGQLENFGGRAVQWLQFRWPHARRDGNRVCVKHVMSLATRSLYLSRTEVPAGSRRAQELPVGASGCIECQTGPDLRFALKRGGACVNPRNLNLPRADPSSRALLQDLKLRSADVAAVMPPTALAARIEQ